MHTILCGDSCAFDLSWVAFVVQLEVGLRIVLTFFYCDHTVYVNSDLPLILHKIFQADTSAWVFNQSKNLSFLVDSAHCFIPWMVEYSKGTSRISVFVLCLLYPCTASLGGLFLKVNECSFILSKVEFKSGLFNIRMVNFTFGADSVYNNMNSLRLVPHPFKFHLGWYH